MARWLRIRRRSGCSGPRAWSKDILIERGDGLKAISENLLHRDGSQRSRRLRPLMLPGAPGASISGSSAPPA
jgi:hypothetical protein